MARVVISMSRARRILTVVPALSILALAGGCGAGKQQVTAAEFGQRADGICRDEQASFRQIQAQPPANASDAADQTKALVHASESASSALDGLEPPDSMRAPLAGYLSARDRAIEQMKRGQDAAENQDSAAYGAAQAAVVNTAPERRKLAGALGLKVCSSSTTGA